MDEMIRVGKIANTHGLKGEIKCIPLTDYVERFSELKYVYIEETKEKLEIESVRYAKGMAYLKFVGLDGIEQIEKYKGKYLIIDDTQKRELPKDSYYLTDLLGMKVYDLQDNYLGEITNIYQTGANDVYELDNNPNYLIPAIKNVINSIDINGKKMKINKLEGLFE